MVTILSPIRTVRPISDQIYKLALAYSRSALLLDLLGVYLCHTPLCVSEAMTFPYSIK